MVLGDARCGPHRVQASAIEPTGASNASPRVTCGHFYHPSPALGESESRLDVLVRVRRTPPHVGYPACWQLSTRDCGMTSLQGVPAIDTVRLGEPLA